MENDSFYLTVNSNSANPSGGLNKPQHFIVNTRMEQPLIGEWEVGLTQLRYPNSWHNVEKNEFINFKYTRRLWNTDLIRKYLKKEQMSEEITEIQPKNPDNENPLKINLATLAEPNLWIVYREKIEIPSQNWESIDRIIEYVNGKQTYMKFTFNKGNSKCSIIQAKTPLANFIVDVGQNANIMKLFGFDYGLATTELEVGSAEITAPFPASISLHMPAIYIYADVVKHQFVSGMQAPLLFDDTITGEYGTYTERRLGPKDAMYLPVAKKYINQLEFEIRDDSGRYISFQTGKIQIRLHFRPKRL